MSTAEAMQRPLRVSKVLAAAAIAALLALLVLPSASQAMQGTSETEAANCDYNEFIATSPCSKICDYNDFIAGARCALYCEAAYNEFIASGPCLRGCDYNLFITGTRCSLWMYSIDNREEFVDEDVEDTAIETTTVDNNQQVQTVAASARPVFVEDAAATPLADSAVVEAALDSAFAASAPAVGLAVTGADDRIPLGGLVLLGVGSFAVAVSRRRLPV